MPLLKNLPDDEIQARWMQWTGLAADAVLPAIVGWSHTCACSRLSVHSDGSQSLQLLVESRLRAGPRPLAVSRLLACVVCCAALPCALSGSGWPRGAVQPASIWPSVQCRRVALLKDRQLKHRACILRCARLLGRILLSGFATKDHELQAYLSCATCRFTFGASRTGANRPVCVNDMKPLHTSVLMPVHSLVAGCSAHRREPDSSTWKCRH
jgi:hypothetical protein